MRRGILLVCALLFIHGNLSADVACTPGTLQDYINLGSDGCTIDSTRFFEFTPLSIPYGATEIDPSLILLTPSGGVHTAFHLSFNVQASAGEFFDVSFGYTMDGGPIRGAALEMYTGAVAPDGVVTAIQDLCLGDYFFDHFCSAATQSMIVFDNGLDRYASETLSFGPYSLVGVIIDIGVDGGIMGSAELQGLTLTVVPGAVPEPNSLWLSGSALIAIGLLARGRRFHRDRVRSAGLGKPIRR